MTESFLMMLLLSHVAATLFMTGVIWFVQLVHYPLFASVGCNDFPAYEQQHSVRTTWVVAPAMFVEAVTALLLFWWHPLGVSAWQLSTGMTLVAVLWLSTALVQVPCHNALSQGFDSTVHQRLVRTNWVRTAIWSLRSLLVLWIAISSFC
jgi:hypothetical protein